MNRSQIENLYKINGLGDYKLRTTVDLMKVHGIDYRAIDGYNLLDKPNGAAYEKFIINIFNGLGLESRDTFIPKGIYYVEDTRLLVKKNQKNDYLTVAGGIIKVINQDGLKWVLHTWKDKNYKHLPTAKSESENYLRFEYKHLGRNEWLHIIK